MRKGIKKQFWLSEKDAADMKQKAQRCGVTETSVIRQLLHGYEPREKPDERFYEAMREMYAIGNNLNQLTAKAHKLGFIDTPMLRELSRAFARFQLKIEQNFLLPVKTQTKRRPINDKRTTEKEISAAARQSAPHLRGTPLQGAGQ